MAFPYKKILCPLAFDENSLEALDNAVAIARQFESSLVLIHVLPVVVALGEVPPQVGLYEDQEKAARAKLADIAKEKLNGLKYVTFVYTGDVIEGILQAQASHRPDLLVMATHGRRGFARMFLGSVTEAVLRKATCPVLIIREEASPTVGTAKKPSAASRARSGRK